MRDVKRGDTQLALKAGVWYVFSNFLVKGMAFITTPIFARIMTREDYGEFSNFASWLSVLLIIAGAELYNTISRAYYDYTDNLDSYVSTVTIASCGITIMLYVLALLFKDTVTTIIAVPEKYIHVLFAALLSQCCKQVFMARERTMYRYKTVAMISVINLVIPTLIATILVLLLPNDQKLSGRIYGFYVPSIIIGLTCGALMLGRRGTFRKDQLKYAFKLSLPLLAHHLTSYSLTSSNTIVTKKMLGAAKSAIVSISSSTVHILTILFHAISGAVTTWLMDNLKQNNYRKIYKDSLLYMATLSVISIGVILLTPEIVWLLGDSRYAEAVSLIPGQILAVLIHSFTSIFITILTYDKNVTPTAIVTGVVAALNVVSKVLLLPLWGIQALPYINVASYAILFVANYILVYRAGYSRAINLKMMVTILLAVAVVSAVSFFLYDHTLIRYGFILILIIGALIIAYKNKAAIIELLKSRKKKTSKIEDNQST